MNTIKITSELPDNSFTIDDCKNLTPDKIKFMKDEYIRKKRNVKKLFRNRIEEYIETSKIFSDIKIKDLKNNKIEINKRNNNEYAYSFTDMIYKFDAYCEIPYFSLIETLNSYDQLFIEGISLELYDEYNDTLNIDADLPDILDERYKLEFTIICKHIKLITIK